ncbi:hypothetical protein [Paraliomyxa miuraensis]|uniref:hypothetical protein n=1 Tax=Paraliomyxa miuraensis TaxID=376150 RepID=UPI00225BA896|nr:hypothetical protein [Paraliomyxa miuraensis]MCX4241757.1 hypothetical protein [Paraliomyxa miuraensis]
MPFFMLECWESASVEYVTLREVPRFVNFSWLSGSLMPSDVLPSPLRLEVMGEPEHVIPPMIDEGIPVFRSDMIETIRGMGVDNFQSFEVELLDTRNSTLLSGYHAVNIIGLVAATDFPNSDYQAHGRPLVDVDFDKLAIDEAKAHGLLMFRLAECVSGIVVDERLRGPLARIGGLSLVDPADWIG